MQLIFKKMKVGQLHFQLFSDVAGEATGES